MAGYRAADLETGGSPPGLWVGDVQVMGYSYTGHLTRESQAPPGALPLRLRLGRAQVTSWIGTSNR